MLIALGFGFPAFAQLNIHQLECEYRKDPLGLDEIKPRLSWQLSSSNSERQLAYQIIVASSEAKLIADTGDLWSSGKVISGITNNIIYFGNNLKSFQKCWWKVRVWDEEGRQSEWSDKAFFSIGPLSKLDWSAEWIGADKESNKANFPLIRKVFELDELPLDAIAHLNAIGYFELFVNGEKVSKDILNPAVSDYSKQTLFVSYNIQPYLKKGINVVGIWLAHGWYRKTTINYHGVVEERPMVRALIQMNHKNNQEQFIRTDRRWQFQESNREYLGGWKWGDFGGEKVYLDRNMEGWSLPNFKENSWKQVENYKLHEIPVVAQRNNPTQIIATVQPVQMERIGDREYLFDFGKHLTGWVNLNFNGTAADSVIEIEFIDKILETGNIKDEIEMNLSEVLNGDKKGRSQISYNQRDFIFPAHQEYESFQNKFNYHAFRWVKIAGLDNESIRKLEALQISENNEQVSSFQCSNPLLNKIWEAVNNTYRCINYSGYVVDCPHRERFGYGGDSHSSMEAALSNFDLAALFNKWTLDWNSGNYPNGLWPHTVPENPNHKNKFSPGWGGFGMFLPWQFYIYYGDTTNLSRAYPYIKQWMSYLQTNVHNGILKKDTLRENTTKWSFHGDWVAPYYGMQPENRVDQLSTKFFNNCFYLYELQMARNIANVLGKTDDAEYYDKLFQKSKPIIHNTFFNPGRGYYANGEQPYQAFPLLVELVPDELKTEIEDYLEYLILEKNNGHLNSGMLGTYFLLEYLMKAGRHDLIYTMVNQKTFPGWGYMVENGATTIWEQWNGDNSQIHNCYLAVGKWFIQGLGGIQPNHEKSGFKNFVIYPGFVEDLNSVEVSYKTRFGEIISSWKQDERKIEHKVVVPVNAVAAYHLPDIEFRQILINGKELDESEVIQLTPGEYEIHLIKK